MYMYKRLNILVLALMALVSCTKEQAVEEVTLQLRAAIDPDIAVLTRTGEAVAEPVVADRAVLQAWRGDVKAAEVTQSITSETTQINFTGVKLAAGVEYDIYIMVYNDGYYVVSDLRSVSIVNGKSFDGKTAEFDAFCYYGTVTCGQNDEVHQVTLTRPLAKVSFSAAVGQDVTISYNAPTTLNLKTGAVSGEKPVSYTATHGVSSVAAFDYVFATEAVSQLNYTFKLGSEDAKTTPVSIKRNTKTNIIYNATN